MSEKNVTLNCYCDPEQDNLFIRRNNSSIPDSDVQLKWLENTLNNSISDYLFVVGHHPMFSVGYHGLHENHSESLKLFSILHKYNISGIFYWLFLFLFIKIQIGYIHGHDHISQIIKTSKDNRSLYSFG